MSGSGSLDELVAGVRAGDRGRLSRALTLVESRRPDHRQKASELLRRLGTPDAPSHRIGISGLPGAGKSTLIEKLGLRLIDAGRRVAVLAVDPTSTITGGSVLGDKTRMTELSMHDRAFVRPSPSGGSLGGVTRTSREVMQVLEAAGFDTVLVETVGVGQSETAVSRMVDTFVVLLVAGAGDELQGIKRGILELADVVAINKTDVDRAAAERARRDFAAALAILQGGEAWMARVRGVSAQTGEGLDELWATITEHRAWLDQDGRLASNRTRQRVAWMWEVVRESVYELARTLPGTRPVAARIEADVAGGTMQPGEGAERLLDALGLRTDSGE